ncbi:MAG: spermidine synthase [Chlamydiales bacterium]|jgi:spermidine synthase
MENVLFESFFEGKHIEVIEKNGIRSLQSDRKIVHSRIDLNDPEALISPYQQQMMLGMVLSLGAESVLHLGLGGGCMVSFIHKYFPLIHQVVTEKSQTVVALAREYFYLPESPSIQIILNDSTDTGPISYRSYDLIFLDLCDSEGPIPTFQIIPYLEKLKGLLMPGGWIVANSWKEGLALQGQLKEWQQLFAKVYYVEGLGESSVIFASQEQEVLLTVGYPEIAARMAKAIPLDFKTFLSALQSI